MLTWMLDEIVKRNRCIRFVFVTVIYFDIKVVKDVIQTRDKVSAFTYGQMF